MELSFLYTPWHNESITFFRIKKKKIMFSYLEMDLKFFSDYIKYIIFQINFHWRYPNIYKKYW